MSLKWNCSMNSKIKFRSHVKSLKYFLAPAQLHFHDNESKIHFLPRSTSSWHIPAHHPSQLHMLSAFHKRRKRLSSPLPRARRCQPSSHWAVPEAHLAPWIVSLSTVGLLSPNKAGTTWPPEESSDQSKDKNKLAATVQGTAPRGTSPTWGQPEEGAKFLLHPRRNLHKVTGGLL